jgi:hypothetical protein
LALTLIPALKGRAKFKPPLRGEAENSSIFRDVSCDLVDRLT